MPPTDLKVILVLCTGPFTYIRNCLNKSMHLKKNRLFIGADVMNRTLLVHNSLILIYGLGDRISALVRSLVIREWSGYGNDKNAMVCSS